MFGSCLVGHHEENQLGVLKWLKRTSKWIGMLMVFLLTRDIRGSMVDDL